jgi:hypothetical protein
MASADWTQVPGGLSSGSLLQGVTAGLTPPPGGGSFVYGMASLDVSAGGGALYANAGSFGPMALGGSARGAVQRAGGAGNTGFAPFLYVLLQALGFGAQAYLLGLSDADPHRIVLVKGTLAAGIPAVPVAVPPQQGVLAVSSASFPIGTWLQLRLDAIVNQNGDTVLNCYYNDLTLGGASVASPTWIAIPGIPQVIDDVLQVNTGSAPLQGGYAGFGMVKSQTTRRALWDEVEIIRQTS